MRESITVLGFAGSLRQNSYNRALIQAAKSVAPANMQVLPFDLGPIPLYNADVDTDEDRPPSVEAFKRSIADADALLVASPEYNFGMPGVLKNAIDWASRPAFKSALAGKPVGVVGASPGRSGAARAQEQVKASLAATLAFVLPHRGVAVASAREKFDHGQLIDEATREVLREFLQALAEFTNRLRR